MKRQENSGKFTTLAQSLKMLKSATAGAHRGNGISKEWNPKQPAISDTVERARLNSLLFA